MSELVEHYAKKNKAQEEARLARMQAGKVVTVYDDTTGGRFPSWMPWVGTKEKYRQVSRSREAMYPSHKTQLYILKQGHGQNHACIYSRLCHRDLEDNSANPTVCDVDDFLD